MLIFLENFRDSTIQRQLYPIVSGPMFPKDPFSRWRSYPCVGRLGQVGGWSIHGRRWRQCCRSLGGSYAATFVWRFLGAIVMQEPPHLVEEYQCKTNVSKDGGSILLVVVVKCKMSKKHPPRFFSVESWEILKYLFVRFFRWTKQREGLGLVNMIVAPIFTCRTPLKHAQVRHACCKRVLQSFLWCTSILH